MSAVDIFATPTRALIFTDAAVYDAEGRLMMLHDKCSVTECGTIAVTGRGNAWFVPAIAKTLDRLGWSIDDIEADGGAFFESCFAKGEELMLYHMGKSANDVFVVGWSARDRKPKIAQWSNSAPADVPRFSMVESVLAPDVSPKGVARIQAAMGPMRPDNVDYVRLGLETMKAQRLETGSAKYAAEGQYLVGGHVQLAEVTAAGVEKRVLHEWPEDKIGERIRPAPALDPVQHTNVTPIAGANRAERRRLEKLQRRGAA